MRSTYELATEICTLAGHLNAATHRLLLLIAEFDRRKCWSAASSRPVTCDNCATESSRNAGAVTAWTWVWPWICCFRSHESRETFQRERRRYGDPKKSAGNAHTSCDYILEHLYLQAGQPLVEEEIRNAELRLSSLLAATEHHHLPR